jgi:hypothetical protein
MAAPANCYLPKPILTLSASSSSWRCSTMPSSIFLSTHEPLVRAARQRLKDAARICCSLAGRARRIGDSADIHGILSWNRHPSDA